MKILSQAQVGYSTSTTATHPNDILHYSTTCSLGPFSNCAARQHDTLGKESNSFQKEDSLSTEEIAKQQKYNSRLALRYIQSLFDDESLGKFYEIKETRTSDGKYKVYNHRTAYCLNRQFDSSQSTYLYSGGKVSNLFKCGNYKCPVCSSKYFMEKRLEIQKVLEWSSEENLFVYMITLTVPHYLNNSYLEVYDLASRCKTKLMKHKVIKDHNPIFTISRQEEPYTRHGFHCHYHCLIGFKAPLDLEDINLIKHQWVKIGKSENININFDIGADIKLIENIQSALNYICKETKLNIKGVASEMTARETKLAKREGMSMYEIIELASQGQWNKMPYDREHIEPLIIEYFSAKKKRIFQGDKGYNKILEIMKNRIAAGDSDADSENPESIEENEDRIKITSQSVYQLVQKKLWFNILLIHSRHENLNNALEEIYIFLNESLGPDNDIVNGISLEKEMDNIERFRFKPKINDYWKHLKDSNNKWDKLLEFYAPLAA